MSDIEFLAIKEFDGKFVSTNTTFSDSGGTLTLTASAVKDLYLAKANCNGHSESNISADIPITINLNANNVNKDSYYFASDVDTQTNFDHDFAVQGIKVVAAQTIELVVTTTSTDCDINVVLVGWEEDTGTTPQIPST